MPRSSHETQRLAAVVLEAAETMDRRRRLDEELGFTEFEQEFQIEVAGSATTTLEWATVTLPFDYLFVYAPGQRDSDLSAPQMTYGAELDADVLLTAHVRSWDRNPTTGAYEGADVRVGVMADAETPYTGTVHITFAGYAAPNESEVDIV